MKQTYTIEELLTYQNVVRSLSLTFDQYKVIDIFKKEIAAIRYRYIKDLKQQTKKRNGVQIQHQNPMSSYEVGGERNLKPRKSQFQSKYDKNMPINQCRGVNQMYLGMQVVSKENEYPFLSQLPPGTRVVKIEPGTIVPPGSILIPVSNPNGYFSSGLPISYPTQGYSPSEFGPLQSEFGPFQSEFMSLDSEFKPLQSQFSPLDSQFSSLVLQPFQSQFSPLVSQSLDSQFNPFGYSNFESEVSPKPIEESQPSTLDSNDTYNIQIQLP